MERARKLAPYSTVAALLLLALGTFLIVQNAWISEDAFITMRYVDNFVSGRGMVYNLEERVEGYSHVLWFYLVSFLHWLGIPIPAAVILPGILFSFLFLYILLFKISFAPAENGAPPFNFAAAILIGVSAFIDFGTSGLETSLSYFLLAVLAKLLTGESWRRKPWSLGLASAALVLNRPDFGIFPVFLTLIYAVMIVRKKEPLGILIRFLAPLLLILVPYELFRMGYYAALFPNPLYAKLSGASYYSQGLKYLLDFFQGSGMGGILLIALGSVLVSRRRGESWQRPALFLMGLLHGFFVIRGGGDFMHGRFLLPGLVLMAIASAGACDRFISKRKALPPIAAVLSLLLLLASLLITPVQKKRGPYHYRVFDDRHYYYKERKFSLPIFFKKDFVKVVRAGKNWEERGLYFKNLARSSRLPIKLAFANVGFTGYFAGGRIYLLDKLGLTDPVVARIRVGKRGRPAHEKYSPLGYLILRRPTFSMTFFPDWDKVAVVSHSGVLWDLSPRTLRKLAPVLKPDFKERIDQNVSRFLQCSTPEALREDADYLFFLQTFWYPFAPPEAQALFADSGADEIIAIHSPAYRWITESRGKIAEIDRHINGPLNGRRFLQNIAFAWKSSFITFEDMPQYNIIYRYKPDFQLERF